MYSGCVHTNPLIRGRYGSNKHIHIQEDASCFSPNLGMEVVNTGKMQAVFLLIWAWK